MTQIWILIPPQYAKVICSSNQVNQMEILDVTSDGVPFTNMGEL